MTKQESIEGAGRLLYVALLCRSVPKNDDALTRLVTLGAHQHAIDTLATVDMASLDECISLVLGFTQRQSRKRRPGDPDDEDLGALLLERPVEVVRLNGPGVQRRRPRAG